MSKVKQDDHGIFIQTGGYIFRPGGVVGYDHAYEMDEGGLKVGDDVKARHRPGTPIAKLTLVSGDVKYWHNASPDDPNRNENLPPLEERIKARDAFYQQLSNTGVKPLKVVVAGPLRQFTATLATSDEHRMVQLGKVNARSYEDAAKWAKETAIPSKAENIDINYREFIVIVGPESDMTNGRSVRKYDYSSLEEISR